MILFTRPNAELVLQGRKTQTRRTGKKRWNVGATHRCQTRLFGGQPFATVKIEAVREEALGAISEEDARAEGYRDVAEFREVWTSIHGTFNPELRVWAVSFVLLLGWAENIP